MTFRTKSIPFRRKPQTFKRITSYWNKKRRKLRISCQDWRTISTEKRGRKTSRSRRRRSSSWTSFSLCREKWPKSRSSTRTTRARRRTTSTKSSHCTSKSRSSLTTQSHSKTQPKPSTNAKRNSWRESREWTKPLTQLQGSKSKRRNSVMGLRMSSEGGMKGRTGSKSSRKKRSSWETGSSLYRTRSRTRKSWTITRNMTIRTAPARMRINWKMKINENQGFTDILFEFDWWYFDVIHSLMVFF